ncbi:hypothetical protein SAMN05216412_102456 [Nitrosospira multiformis]|uniref:Uncharacterized protein n=1 Tax=Nitrosospira multiformis TaxID=1231 RepID=A0A1I0B1K5_9PROT|nr:hypothetical protein SAMN05216412_102456 [Nitrosospira multiformis]
MKMRLPNGLPTGRPLPAVGQGQIHEYQYRLLVVVVVFSIISGKSFLAASSDMFRNNIKTKTGSPSQTKRELMYFIQG